MKWDGAGFALGRGSLRARLWRSGEASWGGALFRGHRQGRPSSAGGAGKFWAPRESVAGTTRGKELVLCR